eukprot:scaffold166812_cov32-Tisochrysis_lutea.AAC.5
MPGNCRVCCAHILSVVLSQTRNLYTLLELGPNLSVHRHAHHGGSLSAWNAHHGESLSLRSPPGRPRNVAPRIPTAPILESVLRQLDAAFAANASDESAELTFAASANPPRRRLITEEIRSCSANKRRASPNRAVAACRRTNAATSSETATSLTTATERIEAKVRGRVASSASEISSA